MFSKVQFKFEDGAIFEAPAEPIARTRAEYFVCSDLNIDYDFDTKPRFVVPDEKREEFNNLISDEINMALNDIGELYDFMSGNMNWNEFNAIMVKSADTIYYEDGWYNKSTTDGV